MIYIDKPIEERAKLRDLGKRLVERMLANPDMIPLGGTKESVAEMLTDGTLDDPHFQDNEVKVEVYFELKDEMASKGIQIFNAPIEHAYSSAEVQKKRAQLMIKYLLDHKCLLSPDTIDEDDLANPKFLARATYSMAEAWCFIWERKLAGIELYLMDADSDDRKHLAEIFEILIKMKKRGAFL